MQHGHCTINKLYKKIENSNNTITTRSHNGLAWCNSYIEGHSASKAVRRKNKVWLEKVTQAADQLQEVDLSLAWVWQK